MTIGEHLQEAIDYTDRGLYSLSFGSACAAITATLKKIGETEHLSEDDLRRFIKENWELIAFMCLPRALPLALNVPFAVKRIEPKFNVHHGADEIVFLIIQKQSRWGVCPMISIFIRAFRLRSKTAAC